MRNHDGCVWIIREGYISPGLWLVRDGSMVVHQKLYMTDYESFTKRRCLWIVREGHMGHNDGLFGSSERANQVRDRSTEHQKLCMAHCMTHQKRVYGISGVVYLYFREVYGSL